MPLRLKPIRYRIEWLGTWLLSKLIPLLPRRALLLLAHIFGDLWFLLDVRSRKVALENLTFVFRDTLPPPRQKAIARASFRNMTRTAMDVFWARRLSAHSWQKRLSFEGFDTAAQLASQRGGIFVLCHFGAFEWLGIASGLIGVRGAVLTQSFKNPLLEPLYNALRASSGQRIISRTGGMLPILRELKRGGIVGMLVDLTLPTRQVSRILPLLGHLTNLTIIHAILHKRTGAPIIPAEAYPQPDGSCHLVAHPPLPCNPEMSEAEIARLTLAFFESRIRARPELWLWSYKYWRFRNPLDPDNAPFYANQSSLFDKKMRLEGLWDGSRQEN